MPPISPAIHLNTLVTRNATDPNSTINALQVVCAWPVSGQYGPGSRVLYYALVAACVIARKADWLRNACLAGALLFPAVAALHGVVLAAMHVNGAVDMDVYGAFQLCSIGILTAPVVVRLSRTYFEEPGRNIIFLWTGLILIGMLSLAVEFFRINTSLCPHDEFGNPVSSDVGAFNYGINCTLTCSIDSGPFSPLRNGSANNIYVIPAPDRLTFNTATLFAAACCIPAILSLVSMWNKILKINWKKRFGVKDEQENREVIAGTNGATVENMKRVNNAMKIFLSAVEVPVFAAAVLTILICGERNFFSPQVNYQTEPIQSIGQWAPIAGTALAVIGSLYLFLAARLKVTNEEFKPDASKQRPVAQDDTGSVNASTHSIITTDSPENLHSVYDAGEEPSGEITRMNTESSKRRDLGKRRKVAKALAKFSDYVGTAARERFDDSEFRNGDALGFPEVPGERQRNERLPIIKRQYTHYNRPGSFNGSVASGIGGQAASATSRAPSPSSPRRSETGILQPERAASIGLQNPRSSSPASLPGRRRRRSTLEVPSPNHYSNTPSRLSTSSIAPDITIPAGQGSPTIVVSSDVTLPRPVHSPLSNPPTTFPPTDQALTPPEPS